MQNFDELAEGYLGLVEKQKVSEGKAVDSFTRGDMETCYVSGAQSMEQLQEGCEGTFGQGARPHFDMCPLHYSRPPIGGGL